MTVRKGKQRKENISKPYLLYQCLKSHDGKATLKQIATACQVNDSVSHAIIRNFNRVYGVNIKRDGDTNVFTIRLQELNKLDVPKGGMRGRPTGRVAGVVPSGIPVAVVKKLLMTQRRVMNRHLDGMRDILKTIKIGMTPAQLSRFGASASRGGASANH